MPVSRHLILRGIPLVMSIRIAPTRARSLFRMLLGAALASAPIAFAADVVHANNTNTANLGTAWTGGTAPGVNDVAVWDNTIPAGGNTTTMGGNLSWAGIRIGSVGGAIGLNTDATRTLTLGTSGIDMSAATADFTIAAAAANAFTLTIGGSQTWNVASTRTLNIFGASNTVNQRLSGSGNINVSGGGTVKMSVGDSSSTGTDASNGNASFSGNWNVSGGSKLMSERNGSHAFGTGSITLDNGTISQHSGNWSWSNNIVVAAGGGTIYSDSSGSARYLDLTGVISGSGTLNFNAAAAMTTNEGFILTGANTFNGAIKIAANATVRLGGDATTTTNSNAAGTLGSLNSTATIENNGILGFGWTDTRTVANNISGTGVVRLGRIGGVLPTTAVVTLSGTNTYSG